MDERHDASSGAWTARTCGRTCGEPIIYRVTYRVTGVDARQRQYERFMCPVHAERYARRWGLVLPGPAPTVDQALLPFKGAL